MMEGELKSRQEQWQKAVRFFTAHCLLQLPTSKKHPRSHSGFCLCDQRLK